MFWNTIKSGCEGLKLQKIQVDLSKGNFGSTVELAYLNSFGDIESDWIIDGFGYQEIELLWGLPNGR